MTKKQKFSSRCIHAGQSPDPSTGAVSVPIYANSTYAQSAPGEHKGFVYGRGNNPTRYAFERCLADLEDGTHGFAFASGLAATCAVLDLLPAGSHIIACDDLYGGTFRLFERIRKETSNITITYVDMTKKGVLARSIKPNTKLIWVETPTNPLLKVISLKSVANAAKGKKILTVCDNTFASPALQRPLNHGFDITLHSITKYIGGHSDLIGGAVVVKDKKLAEKLKFIQNASGAILGPFESFLALRGLKTLSLRMERHGENAAKIASFLAKHKKIKSVTYPGRKGHPQHDIAVKQMSGFGGMITAELKGDLRAAKKFLSACKMFTLAESLGGVESLIEHPAIMTHASVPKEQREALGITDGLIRLSVGIEDADDLIADLEQALKKI
jgi:cystathionine gamma-lyase